MGIERFFSGLIENKSVSQDKFIGNINNKINGNHIFYDSNSILYVTKGSIISKINKILYFLISNPNPRNIPQKIKLLSSEFFIDGNDLANKTPELFISQFNNELLDNLMIKGFINYVLNTLEKYLVKENIKTIYLTFDGVPSKAKMVTQRKRRFTGSVMEELKHKIFAKHKSELEQNEIRYKYEKLKVDWKTGNITPGTLFMKKLSDELTSNIFLNKIKSICSNLIDYTFNGSSTPGEGEYKIVNYLRSDTFRKMVQLNDTHVFYSPDSDAVLLGLILGTTIGLGYTQELKYNTKISNLIILRQNQQSNSYDTINIDTLSSNIFKYIQKLNVSMTSINKDNIISDIVLLLSVFGNDFLPKIESLNVNQHFMTIIDEYTKIILKSNPPKYLMFFNVNTQQRVINIEIMKEIIFSLKKNESKNLQTTYIRNNYYNFKQLKKLLKTTDDKFIHDMNDFLTKTRKLNDDIRNGISDVKKLAIDNLFNKQLIVFLKWRDVSENEVLSKYLKYYMQNGKFPRLNVMLMKYAKTSNTPIHMMNIERKLNNIDPKLKILEYDKELYQLEYMLDGFVNKLNSEKIQLGQISVDENKLMVKTQKIVTGVEQYYKNFFDIDLHDNKKINLLCEKYFIGLMWVFNYYFNKFDEKFHYENGDAYYYHYTHSPLMTQLNEYIQTLDNTKMNNIFSNLEKYKIPRNNYFNCIEQLMYVTPENLLLDIVPNEYHDFINSDPFYRKISFIVEKIWANSPEIPQIIDCRGVFYVSSCHLKIVHENIVDDVGYLKRLRSIKISEKTKLLSKIIKYDEIFSTSKLKTGGSNIIFTAFMCHTCNTLKNYYSGLPKTNENKIIINQLNKLFKNKN